MSLLDLASTVISGVLGGGATGLIGVGVQKYFELKQRAADLAVMKIQHANAVEILTLEQQSKERMAARSAEEREAVAEMDARARENESADRLMAASYEHDRPTYASPEAQDIPPDLLKSSRFARHGAAFSAVLARILMILVDTWRGLIRPGATTYTMYLLTLLFVWVQNLYNKSQMVLTSAQVWELTMHVVGTITYLAVTCLVWWFGIRSPAQKQ